MEQPISQPACEPAVLRALHPGPLRLEQPLAPGGNVIGSDQRVADIIVHSVGVSRRHCWLGHDDQGQWQVRDLKSRNGVYVNGRSVNDRQVLQCGDVIGLGRRRVADFEFLGPSADPRGRTRKLDGPGPWLIGREADLPLGLPADPLVSRQHARVRRQGAHLVIEDLASRNGTWVDGRRQRKARLHPDSRILVGSNELHLIEAGSHSGPVFRLRTVEQAIGLEARLVHSRMGENNRLGLSVAPGRLQYLLVEPAQLRGDLLARLGGLVQTSGDDIDYSENDLNHDLMRQRQRIGLASGHRISDHRNGPEHRQVGTILDDLAVLRLAGDLDAQRRQELVSTTLAVLGIAHLSDWRYEELSLLQRRLCQVAAEMLCRPGLVLIDDPAADLDHDEATHFIQRLRDACGSHLTILILAARPPPGTRVEDQVVTTTFRTSERSGQPARTRPPRRPPSLAASRVLIANQMHSLAHRPIALAEILLLPLLLTPALWLVLPSQLGSAVAVAAVVFSAAGSTAFEISRAYPAIIQTMRRHLVLGDSLLALATVGLVVALAQAMLTLFMIAVLAPGPFNLPGLIAGTLLAALSAVALGLLCVLLAGGRMAPALGLVVVIVAGQLVVADWLQSGADPVFLVSRLGDLSPIVHGQRLVEHFARGAGLADRLHATAMLLGQTLLWLALARSVLGRKL